MLRISEPTYMGREQEYVRDAVESKCLSMGKYVHQFEWLIAEAMGSEFAVATSSGTAALHLALLALGLKPGEKVIVPACSYIATANAVRYCDAIPVFVDVRPDTWLLDSYAAMAQAMEAKAVGIIPVHLYGAICDVPKVPLWVLEDSCEAHGVPLKGDVAVLSFYGNKIVTCGEGGAVATSQAMLAEQVRLLRGQGTTGRQRYVHEQLGFNYRLTDLQAALGCGQIELLASHLRKRHKLRQAYDALLPKNVLQQVRIIGSVDWVVPVRVPNRDRVAASLEAAGIETRPVFPALHQQPPHKTTQRLPTAELLAEEGLLLPLHLGMDEEDVKCVCASLSDALREAA